MLRIYFLDSVEEATSLAEHVHGSRAIEDFEGTDKKYQTFIVTDIKVGFNSLFGFRISIWLGGWAVIIQRNACARSCSRPQSALLQTLHCITPPSALV